MVITEFLQQHVRLDEICRAIKAKVALFVSLAISAPFPVLASPPPSFQNSPVHEIADTTSLQIWLSRVTETRAFPPDFNEALSTAASVSMIEMTTSPGCVPCADLWARLGEFHARYHWQIRTISGQEALLRSGRLGLPWVGHPVAWVRPFNDPARTIPIAIGTDHLSNVSRNAYLATKMLSGVRPSIALRGMARFTGFVGARWAAPRRGR